MSSPALFHSLYVHFPFCESKCHYCDFYSIGQERVVSGDAARFESALKRECERYADQLGVLETIFFGGGTPSMTQAESMSRALEPLRLQDKVTAHTEWTMEANPSSVTLEALQAYRKLGVNRISMGVQALRDDLLLRLGRVHSKDAALTALTTLFEAGFENVSVDLLCGVPGQSIGDLEEALERLTAFPITHLSCYLLTLPKTHRMFAELPDEDTQLAHLLLIHDWMTARGFEHYEISNYAKPGRRARHNLGYWQGSSYLGLGPSAHSFHSGHIGDPAHEPKSREPKSHEPKRWKNTSSLHRWAKLLEAGETAIEWTETLTEEQRTIERWMLGLRLEEGVPSSWMDTALRKTRANALKEQGLLEIHPTSSPGSESRLRLTARGFALSDHVIGLLVSG